MRVLKAGSVLDKDFSEVFSSHLAAHEWAAVTWDRDVGPYGYIWRSIYTSEERFGSAFCPLDPGVFSKTLIRVYGNVSEDSFGPQVCAVYGLDVKTGEWRWEIRQQSAQGALVSTSPTPAQP